MSHWQKFASITALLLLLCILLVTLSRVTQTGNSKVLRVVFPIASLRQDGTLLDPSNTDSVWDYYLLENLAVGLLRDDVAEPDGYRPLLANSWEQVSSHEWNFVLRAGQKWSDGSPITPTQIVEHFLALKLRKSRHLQHLNHLDSATYDSASGCLKLRFAEPTNEGILHELSLADAALMHPESMDWSITSGPYHVESFHPSEKRLVLSANNFSGLIGGQSPRHVELFGLQSAKDSEQIFNSISADLYLVPPFSFAKKYQNAVDSAPRKLVGVPSAVFFLHFDAKHLLSKNKAARREFQWLIQNGIDRVHWKNLEPTRQMIPTGYAGHLSDYISSAHPPEALKGKKLVVDLLEPMDELSSIFDKVRGFAKLHGVEIDFRFRNFSAAPPEGAFAHFLVFQGNQKDSLGSWSFLFAEKTGQLEAFRGPIQKLLFAASSAESLQLREQKLHDLHDAVLDHAIVVPFLAASSQLLASDRIDLSRINPFDLRPRFYELIWRR